MSTLAAPVRRVQTTVRKPRPKPVRTIRLCIAPSPINTGVVHIAVGGKGQDYLLNEVEGCAFGRGFLLSKIGHEEQYHVNIDGPNRSCECPGFQGNGRSNSGGRCKHADGLAALIAADKL